MNIRLSAVVSLIGIGVAGTLLGACQQTKPPHDVLVSLENIRTEAWSGHQTFENAVSALRGLSDSTPDNRQPSFANFSQRVKELDEKAGGVGFVVGLEQERSEDYFKKWEQQVDSINNQDLQESSGETHAKAMAQYDEIKVKIARLRGSFKPFMSNLQDINKYLTNDPSQAGFNSAKPSIHDALDRADDVRSNFDSLMKSLDKVLKS